LFDETGGLDPDATAAHAVRMVEAGMRAILVAGTTGEPWTLSEEEQAALVKAVVRAVDGAVPVIAGVRGEDAVERAIHALAAGADAILALSPPDHLDGYYADVAAVGLPTLAYHFPRVSAPGIPVDALTRLPVVGLKDSSGNLERLRLEIHEWGEPVYTGSAGILLEAARSGAAGGILSIANLEPERAIAVFGGDEDAQRDFESVEIAALKVHMADRFGTSPTTRS
jgi:4-hydroxy-tetrahydrodipicolinate synthase